MESAPRPEVVRGDGWSAVRFTGVIDEHSRLPDLHVPFGTRFLFIDLGGVERINSCGVRDWMDWIDQVSQPPVEVVLLECSPPIVAQLNLVGGFAGRAAVQSIQAPYYCEHCDREAVLVLSVSELLAAPRPAAPPAPCDRCGQAMVFDDIEQSYFAFLRDVRPAHPHPALQSALEAMRSVLAGGPPAAAPPSSEAAPPQEHRAPASEPAPMRRADVVFYLAVGVLTAVLVIVLTYLARS